MERVIKVGTVSWINDISNPMYSTLQVKALPPEWIPKTYLGLSATSNHSPPATVNDFKSYQRLKDFRAMTYCHFALDTDNPWDLARPSLAAAISPSASSRPATSDCMLRPTSAKAIVSTVPVP
jgi:hypothetical protein